MNRTDYKKSLEQLEDEHYRSMQYAIPQLQKQAEGTTTKMQTSRSASIIWSIGLKNGPTAFYYFTKEKPEKKVSSHPFAAK